MFNFRLFSGADKMMLNVPITCILYESTIEEASEHAFLDCAC